MSGRQTRGRQRIPITRIANRDDLYATFSKRRQGLYKKASELSTLCGVDIGIIIFSPTNNPYSFFHPNMQSVVDRYRNPDQPRNSHERVVESTTRSRIDEMNTRLDEILDEKEQLKEHNKYLNEIDRTRQKGWWEETPIESLNKQEVKEWIDWFQAFKDRVESRIEELQNPQNFPDAPGPSTFAPGPSHAPNMGDEQFAGQYYDPSSFDDFRDHYFYPPLSENPPAGGDSGHVSNQFIFPPPSQDQFFVTPRSEDPSASGSDHISGQPTFQDPSTGGSGFFPSQSFMFIPPPPLNPSIGDGSTQSIPEQYRYIPRETQNASTVRVSGDVGSSQEEHANN